MFLRITNLCKKLVESAINQQITKLNDEKL